MQNTPLARKIFDARRRKLFVGAHPDDVEMFAGYLVHKSDGNAYVAIATDGAPRIEGYYPHGNIPDAETYTQTRRNESLAVLNYLGVPKANVSFFGYTDQEVVFYLASLVKDLSRLINEIKPDQIFAPAYEGSHPDHDAIRIAVNESAKQNGEIENFEYASCNYKNGRLEFFKFIPRRGFRSLRVRVPTEGQHVKATVFDMFESQKGFLDPIPQDTEAYRLSPPYDFSNPPHSGTIFYEVSGMPLSPQKFLENVANYYGDKK